MMGGYLWDRWQWQVVSGGIDEMCLGTPGRVVKIADNSLGIRMGIVDFCGTRVEVCLSYLDEVNEGDWVIVHTGFAISKIDEARAKDVFDILKGIGL